MNEQNNQPTNQMQPGNKLDAEENKIILTIFFILERNYITDFLLNKEVLQIKYLKPFLEMIIEVGWGV